MPPTAKTAPSTAAAAKDAQGPNFAAGVPLASCKQGVTFGHVNGEPALLSRAGSELRLLSSTCSHYGAPLAGGLVHGDTIRCPWHHACFSLRDGSVQKAPGLAPLQRWHVRTEGGTLRAGPKQKPLTLPAAHKGPSSVAIVGGGAAAFSAAVELQQHGYAGEIVVFSDEPDALYDRIKLSKGVLAGAVGVDALALPRQALRNPKRVQVRAGTQVTALDAKDRTLHFGDGKKQTFGAVLLAPGGQPRVPSHVKVDGKRVFTLRNKQDVVAIRRAIAPGSHVVIAGANFIGMEAASSLKDSGAERHVLSPADLPFLSIFGRDIAQVLRSVHEQDGVTLHRGRSLKAVGVLDVTLDDDTRVPCDVLLLAMGVEPRTELAKQAGLKVDNGIVVDACLRTSAPNVYAAGDAAHLIDEGASWRIEHWAVAEQMGRVAARNMLGANERYRAVPFFWTEQVGYKFRYVGHAKEVTRAETFGDIEDKKAVIALYEGEKISAVVTVGRDDVSLACEVAMEEGRHGDLPKLVRL